jgi:hypothetical protein
VAQLVHAGERVLLEHRLDREPLDLDDAPILGAVGRAVGDPTEDGLLLDRASPESGLLLEVDRAALDLVDDRVDARLVRRRGGMATQRPSVDDEGDLDDVRVIVAAVLLERELDDGVAAVVQEPLDPPQALLRVAAHRVANREVLALDDRSHAHLPAGMVSRFRETLASEYSPGSVVTGPEDGGARPRGDSAAPLVT